MNDENQLELDSKVVYIMDKAMSYLNNGYKNMAVAYADVARNLSNDKEIVNSFASNVRKNDTDDAETDCESYKDYKLNLYEE